jgi:serine/threonine protein kinase/tetratricopeptide (TPR) repeat protein
VEVFSEAADPLEWEQQPVVAPTFFQSTTEAERIGKAMSKGTETSRIGRYVLAEELGRGAMGSVHRAQLQGPAGFQKTVAVKLIRTEGLESRHLVINEARLGGLLKHPNVVETYELGEEDGQLYIAIEYVDGLSLSELLRRWERLPVPTALDIACQVCQGLHHIHTLKIDGQPAGMVHRDLKPSNILIGQSGLVKVADLGIAKAFGLEGTEDGRRQGTPAYMSPEQVQALPLDASSDVFSLGAIIYEMLVGVRLFQGRHPLALMGQIRSVDKRLLQEAIIGPLQKASLPLSRIVQRCLLIDPSKRFRGTLELLHALRKLPQQDGMDLYSVLSHELDANQDISVAISADSVLADVIGDDRPSLTSLDNGFVGRGVELEHIAQSLSRSRLVVLKGPGGIGKTRLVSEFIRCNRDFWPDFCFIDLETAQTGDDLLQAMLTALGLRPEGRPVDSLVPFIGASLRGRGRMLLVLDRFEDLSSELGTVEAWLEQAPEVRCLLTTRVTSETDCALIGLGSLSVGESRELLLCRLGERGFPKELDTGIQNRLLKLLDGIPLAIELAAAQLDPASPSLSLKKLLGSFGGNPLQAALVWSWKRLQPWERSAMVQLQAFEGAFSLQSADHVLDLAAWPDAPWSEKIVDSLLAQSLIYSKKGEDQPLFGLFSCVRTFVAEKASDPELQSAYLRHATHYAERMLAEENMSPYYRFAEVRARSLSDLMVAVGRCRSHRWNGLAARCALIAAEVLLDQGPYARGLNLLRPLSRLKAVGDWEKGMIQYMLGRYSRHMGRASQSRGQLRNAVQFFEVVGDARAMQDAWVELAYTATDLGDNSMADSALSSAMGLGATTPRRQGAQLRAQGYALAQRGELGSAAELLLRSLPLFRAAGDVAQLIGVQTSLGVIAFRQGRLAAAQEHYLRALRRAQKHGVLSKVDHLWMNLGVIAIYSGQCDRALRLFERAANRYRGTGALRPLSLLLANWALLLVIVGSVEDAEDRIAQSLDLQRQYPHPIASHTAHKVSGLIHLLQGRIPQAREQLRQALQVVSSHGLTYKAADTHALYAEASARLGDVAGAEESLRRSESETSQDPTLLIQRLCARVVLFHQEGKGAEARRELSRAKDLLGALDMPRPDLWFQHDRILGWMARSSST